VHAGQIQCESSPRDHRHQKQIRRKTKEVKKTGHGPSGHTQCHGRSADYIMEEIPSQPFSELAGQQYIIHLAIVCVSNERTIFLNAVSQWKTILCLRQFFAGGGFFKKFK
jgi:hypothetical protein